MGEVDTVGFSGFTVSISVRKQSKNSVRLFVYLYFMDLVIEVIAHEKMLRFRTVVNFS